MKQFLALPFILTLVSCGVDKKEDSDKKEDAVDTDDVEFSGYVQKAFAIKVNEQDFSDSEDFYTRFIEELVKPAYPDVADNDIKLEGKYGLDEFGSLSKVYMSSMLGEGHLYEGRTDAQSKFTIQVQSKALDETFKARIVIRIGLEIAEGSDGSDLHYCYLLHGNKEGVAISDSSKPIIFESFATQLTKYKCEEVNEDTLVIPGLGGENEASDDSASLRAVVSSTVNIASTLNADYQGDNVLSSATMTSSGELIIVKKPVLRGSDGKWCIPLTRLSSLNNPTATETCLGSLDQAPHPIDSVAVSGDTLLGTTLESTVTFKSDGSQWDEVASDKIHDRVVMTTVLKSTDGLEACDWPGASCAAAAASNKCDLGYPQTVAWFSGAYLMANGVNSQGSGYCGAGAIHVMSSGLAYQRKYPVSTTDVPAAEFNASKLVSSGSNLYLISLVADKIVARKLDLTEE